MGGRLSGGNLLKSRQNPLTDKRMAGIAVKRAFDGIEELSARQTHLFGHLTDVEICQLALAVRDERASHQLTTQVETIDAMV